MAGVAAYLLGLLHPCLTLGRVTHTRNTSPKCGSPGGQGLPESCSQHYLGFLCSQHIHHDLHHCLVHAKDSHEVGVLIKHLVVHYVSRMRIREKL